MNEESTRIRKLARAKLQAIKQEGRRTTRKSGKARAAAVACAALLAMLALTTCALSRQGVDAPKGNPTGAARQAGQDGESTNGETAPSETANAASEVQASSRASASVSASQEATASASSPSPAPAASNDASASRPMHEHSWQAVTEQKWVPNNVWVQDSAAWDEQIYGQQTRSICNGCGADITGNPWAHIEAAGRGSACNGYHSESYSVVINTIHHDATGHYEDQGHYETVTTGYACSGCGAAE